MLLGVDDDGRIVGAQRERLEDCVAELCRVKLEPQVLPSLAWVRDAEPGRGRLSSALGGGLQCSDTLCDRTR